MQKLRLAADYCCYPVWWNDGIQFGDIDPSELPLSPDLIADLMAWSDIFDAIYVDDDPVSSGFATRAAEQQFAEQGLALAQRLQAELGAEYQITYTYRVKGQD
ncbi:hypothetical protein [Herpetosiphon giganteus]|uniref:hypothetical protein n=1 Tax=Herpetosiphon giganteus TaxID=2029754 RepID=UPI00195E87AC|nr:hypothetical protein [Herpetosiphon giganteus]MBM7844978.1 hypothetical protein [Herpetosiphon giganteus]